MAVQFPMGRWLAEKMAQWMPDFVPFAGAKPRGYWFRRLPHPRLFSIIYIQSSQKQRCLSADVASTLMPTWDGWYGHHQMVTATNLVVVRLKSKSTPMGEELYFHDGTVESVRATLDRIGADLVEHAAPFFADRERDIAGDPLISSGMAWLRARQKPLFPDRTKMYFGRNERLQAVQDPILDELKSVLRQECTRIGATKLQRQETAILALHLLDYAQAGMLE